MRYKSVFLGNLSSGIRKRDPSFTLCLTFDPSLCLEAKEIQRVWDCLVFLCPCVACAVWSCLYLVIVCNCARCVLSGEVPAAAAVSEVRANCFLISCQYHTRLSLFLSVFFGYIFSTFFCLCFFAFFLAPCTHLYSLNFFLSP